MVPYKIEGVYPETGEDMVLFKQWDNAPRQSATMREIQGCESIWKDLAFVPSEN